MMRHINKPILAFLNVAKAARTFKKYSDEDLLKSAMEAIKLMYPKATQPIRWARTSWEDDKFSRMSYTFFKANSSPQDCQNLFEAESMKNKIWFAGEAANGDLLGNIQGAMISGSKASRELAKELFKGEAKL